MASQPPSSSSSHSPEYTLHTYFRSSSSGRIRIALNLKGLPYEPVFVNLLKNEHKNAENLALNPLGFVPTLISKEPGQDATAPPQVWALIQSMAILEYLEEAHPDHRPLLPPASDIRGRAHVRALANVIACDVQPVTNLRILRRVAAIDASNADASKNWAKELMTEGFAAYEKMCAPLAGMYSYGDAITLADVCLVPAMYGALRFGVPMEAFPTVKRVFENLSKEKAVVDAHWMRQGDCPEELREQV